MNLPRVLVGAFVVGAIAWLVRRYGPLQRFEIAETSMTPSLRPGDYVVTIRRRPRRGAIVVYPHPHRQGFYLTKRVVGLPGERVSIREGGLVLIDGIPLAEPWAHHHQGPEGDWIVPPAHVFVMGDHRHHSRADSRFLGPVPMRDLDHILLRYRPLIRVPAAPS